MGLRIVTPAAGYPVTLADAKKHLRVDADLTGHDDVITSLIAAASQHVEAVTGRVLLTTTLELVIDSFPAAIQLPRAPIASVAAITYYDPAGSLQTLSSNRYALDNVSEPGWIVPAGQGWPMVAPGINNVTIRLVAGYADAASVPAVLIHATKLLVGHWFANREAVSDRPLQDVPATVAALLANHRLY